MLKGENLVVFGEIQGIPCYFRAQVPYACVNSLYTSSICRYPLQTVWTWIRPDKMLVLIWIKLHDTLMKFLKDFFKCCMKKSADNKEACTANRGWDQLFLCNYRENLLKC